MILSYQACLHDFEIKRFLHIPVVSFNSTTLRDVSFADDMCKLCACTHTDERERKCQALHSLQKKRDDRNDE
jgi:hypothetical protein